jgi:hypothetical protein
VGIDINGETRVGRESGNQKRVMGINENRQNNLQYTNENIHFSRNKTYAVIERKHAVT